MAEDGSANTYVYAGDATDLSVITPADNIWHTVSATPGGYTTTENWRFAQFKAFMLATNFNDPIQYNTLGNNVFSELSSDAPNARHIAVAKNFVIVANTNDPVGGMNPDRAWWSGNGMPTSWPTPGTPTAQEQQSDYNDIPGYQGGITGLVPNLTGCDCAVFFERGIQNMFYVGPPDVFNFYPSSSGRGTRASNSIVVLGSTCFFLDEDGFYSYDGSNCQPVGAQKFDKWFFANVDQSRLDLVIGAADVANRAIVWVFKSIYNTLPYPDMGIYYRWDIGRACMIENWGVEWVTRTAVPSTNSQLPPEAAPLVKNALQFAGITYPGHQLAYPVGLPMPAQIGTQVQQIVPGYRAFVRSTRPLVGLGSSASASYVTEDGTPYVTETGTQYVTEADSGSELTIAVSARTNYQDSETFGPEVAIDSMGECPQRSDGRYHRGRVTISGLLWGPAYGIDFQAVRAGLR